MQQAVDFYADIDKSAKVGDVMNRTLYDGSWKQVIQFDNVFAGLGRRQL